MRRSVVLTAVVLSTFSGTALGQVPTRAAITRDTAIAKRSIVKEKAPPIATAQRPMRVVLASSRVALDPRLKTRPAVVRALFDYRMQPRFGLDADRNGFPDLPNTRVYVFNGTTNDPTFVVTFDASASRAMSLATTSLRYSWRIAGGGPALVFHDSIPTRTVRLREGTYDVTLVVEGEARRDSVTRQVKIEDILFVSIGDSYSSGEGNPERPNQWATSGTGRNDHETQQHRLAHRSTLSWPAQAALLLEQADPHTSVTFVSVAATGATLRKLLFDVHDGAAAVEKDIASLRLPPQIKQLDSIVGGRPIDVFTVSIGINDIGFSPVITALMFKNAKVTTSAIKDFSFQDLEKSLATGDWTPLRDLNTLNWALGLFSDDDKWTKVPGLNGLASGYRSLDSAIKKLSNSPVRHVYIAEYPDATGTLEGGSKLVYCPEMMSQLNSATEAFDALIDAEEARWMYEHAFRPLSGAVHDGADRNGWKPVSGLASVFGNGGHGYCSTQPYTPSGYVGNPFPGTVPLPTTSNVSWFRTAHASSVIEGPKDDRIGTMGTMHPNELGHRLVAEYLLAFLDLPVRIAGIGEGIDPVTGLPKLMPADYDDHGWYFDLNNPLLPLSSHYEIGGKGASVRQGIDEIGIPYTETGMTLAGHHVSASANPGGASVSVDNVTAKVDLKTGAILAIKTGNDWVDLAGNVITGNIFEAAKAAYKLFTGSDASDEVGETPAYRTSDDCVFIGHQDAMAHEAEYTHSTGWLVDHGYIHVTRYANGKCDVLHEWRLDTADPDGDGLANWLEKAIGTDPSRADSDGDGVSDGEEVNTIGTKPMNPDSDGDGYSDGREHTWWKGLSERQRKIALGLDPNDGPAGDRAETRDAHKPATQTTVKVQICKTCAHAAKNSRVHPGPIGQ